ncbi:MAG: hypothetical protein EOP42_28250 [Sphingobacteriaceae bacterium]|nr:MAG: hypothetical protein EOP42_28250 [Sphingobacteriaceae bacterium]
MSHTQMFTNPLINADFPDPSVIYVSGDGYYAYATHDEFSPTINNIQLSKSDDLVNWSEPIGALIEPPVWAKTCNKFWAPQVVKVADQYRLYYAAESDTKDGMCLALAISDKPYNFKDIGKPLAQVPGSTYKMIDPCFFYDVKSGKSFFKEFKGDRIVFRGSKKHLYYWHNPFFHHPALLHFTVKVKIGDCLGL